MSDESDEEELLRLAALKNAQSIFLARQRAKRELLEAVDLYMQVARQLLDSEERA